MSMPVRIQRQRTKGWRMPAGAVYVGRPGRFGNPFRVVCLFDHRPRGGRAAWGVLQSFQLGGSDTLIAGFDKTHDDVVEARDRAVTLFRKALADGRLKIDVAPLRGKTLACWCPLEHPCHADVLLELANAMEASA